MTTTEYLIYIFDNLPFYQQVIVVLIITGPGLGMAGALFACLSALQDD